MIFTDRAAVISTVTAPREKDDFLFPVSHDAPAVEIQIKIVPAMKESSRREGIQKSKRIMSAIKTTHSTEIGETQRKAQNKEKAAEGNDAENRGRLPIAEPDDKHHTAVGNTDFTEEGQQKGFITKLLKSDEEQNTVTSVPETSGSPANQLGSESKCKSAPAQALCDDEEVMRRAREEGCVDVVFAGSVTQDGCCRFVCELLKCVLYQRQQLPMTYDQMVFFQKQHTSFQSEDGVNRKSGKTSESMSWHHCQRTLQDLDEVLTHLQTLFSLTHVPCVLFMLGGSPVLPTELYEVNMEALVVGGGDQSLRTSVCLRQLFRILFVADLLSDVKPIRLMPTTIMALGHRNCGVAWFKPKINFKIPARVKRRVISLTSDTLESGLAKTGTRDLEDYIWFQAPVTVKGFCK